MLLPLVGEIVLEIGEGDFAFYLIPISASGLDELVALPTEHVKVFYDILRVRFQAAQMLLKKLLCYLFLCRSDVCLRFIPILFFLSLLDDGTLFRAVDCTEGLLCHVSDNILHALSFRYNLDFSNLLPVCFVGFLHIDANNT